MSSEPDENRELTEVAERLTAQFPAVPADTVREIVTGAWAEFAGRPIRDFVPVLAERKAKQSLRDRPAASHTE